MNKINIAKSILVFFILTLSISIDHIVFAELTPYSEAHWCLTDSNGQTTSGCSGPKLSNTDTAANINYFLPAYQNLTPFSGTPYVGKRIVVSVSKDTSHTPTNMQPQSILSTVYSTPNHYFYADLLEHWEYISKVIIFGGSDQEGQLLLPGPSLITTAHKRNAQVFGTLFFYDTSEDNQIFNNLITSPQAENSLANQLIEISEKYKVDGYFIDVEQTPFYFDSDTILSFLQYMRDHNVAIEWYSFDNLKSDFLMDNENSTETQVADSVFVDMQDWSNDRATQPTVSKDNTVVQAISEGFPGYKAEYENNNIWSNGAGNGRPCLWNQQSYCISTALSWGNSFMEWPFNTIIDGTSKELTQLPNPAQQDNNVQAFWSMAAKAGSLSPRALPHPMLSDGTLFATSFNTGKGLDYYVNGIPANFGGLSETVHNWYDIGLQDYLPIIISNPIYTDAFDYKQAYNGGSSLSIHTVTEDSKSKYSYTLFNNLNDINKTTNTPIFFRVTYLPITVKNDTAICLEMENTTKCIKFTKLKANNKKWIRSIPVKLPANETLKNLTITISGKPGQTSDILLGNIYIAPMNNMHAKPLAPQNVQLVSVTPDLDGEYFHHVFSWQQNNNAETYLIYDTSHQFLGATNRASFDVINKNANIQQQFCIYSQNSAGLISANAQCT